MKTVNSTTVDKCFRFEYSHSDALKKFIDEIYFANNNNGKLSNDTIEHLTLKDDDLYYKVLTGLPYDIKIRNRDLIDGSMKFKMDEEGDTIKLIPTSQYCIKLMDESGEDVMYSFY